MFDVKIYSPDDFPNYLPNLNSMYDELFSGGKGFRSKMVQMVSESILLEPKTIQLLCQTIEFIHNASLLHDDLIDRAPLRRNKTAAWLKYSPEYAVLAGDYLLARVMVNLSRFGNIKLIQYTAEVISDLLEGEWLQDAIIKDAKTDSSSLDRVHKLKTASLFEWCIRSPFIAAENYNEEIHKLLSKTGSILGILFQRGDDLLDFNVRNFENKKILGDLSGGYLNSFGVFLAEGLELSKRVKLFDIRSMEELYSLIGKEYFDERLSRFDEINSVKLAEYRDNLEKLKSHLSREHQGLTEAFKPLADILYWRKTDV